MNFANLDELSEKMNVLEDFIRTAKKLIEKARNADEDFGLTAAQKATIEARIEGGSSKLQELCAAVILLTKP